jgi:hypothetical protein
MQAQPDSLRPTQLSFERGQRAMIKVLVLAASGRERRSRVEVCVNRARSADRLSSRNDSRSAAPLRRGYRDDDYS